MFIVLICLSINFIGDGLRDAFDPRQKKFNAKKAAGHGGPPVQAGAVTGLDSSEQAGFRPEGPGHDGPADGTRGQ
jgi:peptide/nickel transport system permease protein